MKFIKTYFLKKFNEFLDKQTFFLLNYYVHAEKPCLRLLPKPNLATFSLHFCKTQFVLQKTMRKNAEKMSILGANVFESYSTSEGLPNLKIIRSEDISNIALIFVFEVIKYPPGHSFQIIQSFGVLAQCALQSCKKDRTRNFICVQLESNYPIVH